MLGVKNLSGKKLVAKYDGKEYTFEADEKVTTPLADDAARHIFGYGEDNKTKALLRLGWVANGAAMEEAVERLGQFQFLAVEDIKFKGDEEVTMHLPRKVASDAPQGGADLSPEELAIGEKLQKPEGKAKKFARHKN